MFSKNRTLAIRVGNYQSRDINEASFDYGYIKGDTYKPGGTCAGSGKITFTSIITTFNKLDKIYPEIGLLVDGTYEWVKMGEYFINDIEIDRNRNTTTLDLMDGMFKLNREHVTDLTYPAEIRNVIKEICLKTGVELANETMGLASMNYRIDKVPKDKKMTFRDVLGLSAQMLGMSCFFNREGKLEVKELTDSGIVITADSYFMHGLTKSEIEYQIAGITCKKDKETLTVGLRTGRSLELDNLFMSQSVLDNLYHNIKDIRYYPFSLNYQGHLLLDVGQWVTIKTNTGETFKSPVLSQSFKFKGGLRGRISADSKAGNDAQYSYAGTITKKIEQFNEFEAQLQNQIEEADKEFDRKVQGIKGEITDGIEQAKAVAEENKKKLSDVIDSKFNDFDTGINEKLDEQKNKLNALSETANNAYYNAFEALKDSSRSLKIALSIKDMTDSNFMQISQINDTIETLARKSELDPISDRLSITESKIEVQAGQIIEKLSRTDFDRLANDRGFQNATQVQNIVRNSVDGFQRTVSRIETKLRDIIRNDNLLQNSSIIPSGNGLEGTWALNGSGGNATVYKAGNGIEISNGNVITNTQPNVNQNLSINGRTITISNGNSITLPEDRDTVYNDTELKRRVQAVEAKTDNFVSGVSVSREGNKVKLTYTFVNGAPKEVEFEDKDTITLAYDDTALKARVKALEDRPDRDTVYNDKPLRDRIALLENKEPQGLNYNNDTNELSLTNGGNSVTIPNGKQTISRQGNKLVLSNGGGEVDLPQPNSSLAYDDSDLRRRVGLLESKPDKDTIYDDRLLRNEISTLKRRIGRNNQTLTINDRTISISEGNSITLPEDRDTIYNDTDIKNRLTALEGKADKDSQTLDLNPNTRVLSISNGNNVTLPNDKQTISRQGNKLVLSNGGGEVDLPQSDNAVSYDDTHLRNRVTALESKQDRDNQTLTFNEGNRSLSISGGNSITIPNDKQTLSKSGNKIVLSNGGGEVDIPTPTPYNDADIKRRLGVLEARRDNDNQSLSVNGNTLSISGGNSITLPQSPVHRFYDGDIPGAGNPADIHTVDKSKFRNPDGIKVGDTLEDHWADNSIVSRGIWKVLEVSGNNIKVQGIGNYSINLRKNLTLNPNTRVLSIDGGNNVTLPNDKQSLTLNGNTLSISGGNSVTIPQPNLNNYVTVQQYNELKGALEKLLQDLKNSGAWQQTGGNILQGNLYGDRHIATGNINLFSGTVDGGAFIRTNNGRTENDLAGGIG